MGDICNTTVSDLQIQNKLKFQKGFYNIIDCGIRTGKTYWAVNNLKQFSRDGQLNRILFLVDTTALKDQIIKDYDDCADVDTFWENPNLWGEQVNKIGVMCYQALGIRAIRGELGFLDDIDVICWDECDSIFNFATQAFTRARKTDFARKEVSNAEVLSIIQQYSSKKEYMPLVLLGAWERIIIESRIMCIGLSASPERAQAYYKSLISASNQGKLEAGYRIAADIYYYDLAEHIRQLQPTPGHGYWCYSPYIEGNKGAVAIANERGFKAIELHSPNNKEKPMTEEQMQVYNCIVATGMVPPEYDFVVVNAALQRGININDRRFDSVIINSIDAAERIQAARQTFEYTRHLKVFAPEVPASFKDKWLTVSECRELAELMAVPEMRDDGNRVSRIMTWNRLKDCLPYIGYTVQDKRKRINGKMQQCYFISGNWHDAEIENNQFLELAAAATEMKKEKGDNQ